MAKPTAPLPPKAVDHPIKAPQNACDTHVHILAGPDELPLWDGRTQDPAQSFEEYLDGYRAHLSALGITRGVIVHSIFYGTDNAVTVKAVNAMGAGFAGVGLLPDDATDAELDQFAAWGMRAVRLNYVHGGVLTWDGAKAMAGRLADRGLHIQMLMNADKHMPEIAPDLASLPVPVVFDHLGWPDLKAGPREPGFQLLCNALAQGHAYIKLSALNRLQSAPYDSTDPLVACLVDANVDRVLWGSDWPHIMLNGAEMPASGALWEAFHRSVPSAKDREKILVQNPERLYNF